MGKCWKIQALEYNRETGESRPVGKLRDVPESLGRLRIQTRNWIKVEEYDDGEPEQPEKTQWVPLDDRNAPPRPQRRVKV